MLTTKFRFIWPSGFRGEDFKKSANQKQELPVAAMFVNGSGQNVQSLERTFYRCFLPIFSSFGGGVSEEKIKMWKVSRQQMTDAKLAKAHIAFEIFLKRSIAKKQTVTVFNMQSLPFFHILTHKLIESFLISKYN